MKAIRLVFISLLFVSVAFAGSINPKKRLPAPAVAGWYFRAVSGYPAAIAFEPVVLFKNGDYYDVGEEPLENLNIAQDKQKRPAAWGTWKKNGNTFVLTNYKNKSHDYELGNGNWFPAFAYTGAIKLKSGYEKVSGGDYGNGTNALSITKINFVDATHYTQGKNAGVTSAGSSAWGKSSSGGTYKITAHTITFTTGDGKVIKQSFALGASGNPARPTNTIIFIGGNAYTDTE